MIKIKRIYDLPSAEDGVRILIDRLWPRGLSKNGAKVDLWLKEIAPSDKLRKWFAHDPKKWIEFKQKYFKELNPNQERVDLIIKKAKGGNVTLLFGAKEERFNNTVALKEYVETRGKGVELKSW
ncbi:MAG: DUF488 domain-containing protein [Desulfobacterales bacterium]|nr:DUF488 domain-containing protein [Desulfobacterales bacterium]